MLRLPGLVWPLLAAGLLAPAGAAQSANPKAPVPSGAVSDLAGALRTPGALQSRVRFDHVTTADGLSNDSVFSILQDHYGFLWFGTQAGLNRYDGYRVTQYRHDPKNPNSLADDFVHFLVEDRRGAIWTGSSVLCRFDPEKETFTRFPIPYDHATSGRPLVIQAIAEDGFGRLWLGMSTGRKVYRFNPETGNMEGVDIGGSIPPGQDIPVVSMHCDPAGMIWFGASQGLIRLDPSTGVSRLYATKGPAPRAIAQNGLGDFWLAVPAGVPNFFDPVRGTFAYRWEEAKREHPNTETSSILADRGGLVWLGTSERLEIFDPATGALAFLRHDAADRHSISANEVLSLAMDREGGVWVGTKGRGANRFSPETLRFGSWRPNPADRESLSDENVRAVYRDREGGVWMGTYDGGLNRFDPVSGKFVHFRHDAREPQSLDDDRIYSIYEDRAGALWVGTGVGINRLDRKTGTFAHFRRGPLDGGGSAVPTYTMLEDRSGRFWLGVGENRGILDRQTGAVTLVSPTGGQSAFEDREGNLWFASAYGGLTKMDASGKTRKIVPAPGTNVAIPQINYMYEDGQGVLWFAAETGLLRFHPKSEEFTTYTTADGLPDNVVQCILPDEAGNLWLSTNSGISRFDPRDHSFRNYHESDGLQSEQFNRKACFVDASGRMYFGGLHGFNIFDPRRIPANPREPSQVVLTEFRIQGKVVPVHAGSMLPRPVWQMRKLDLSYKDDGFSFEFAALSYRDQARARYRFLLEGLESQWTEVDSRNRTARYTGLAPRTYRFRVQSSIDGKRWSAQEASVWISIAPPWWMTPWSRVAMTLGVLTLLFAVYKLRVRVLEQREARLQALVDDRTAELVEARNEAERANRAKSTFLANMSHELRTPLNAILGFSNLLRERSDSEQQRRELDIIHRSGQHLLGLINDVLDIAKIEAGRTVLELGPCDVKALVQDVADMMQARAAEKRLALVVADTAGFPLYVRTDAAKLREILINLLGNAVKYTEEGSVTLRFSAEPDSGGNQVRLCFAVEDTGVGIAPEDQERIFEAFEQAGMGSSQTGTGLGLAITRQFVRMMGGRIELESALGRGSCFRVTIAAERADEQEAISTLAPERVPQLEAGQPEYRILVVDDDPENRALLENLLREAGFAVRVAESGEQGVEGFREWRPHFIWMDLRMPGIGGIRATERIRVLDGGGDVKIVAVTASSSGGQRSQALAAGLDDYLAKPYRTAEIFECMARHLRVRYRVAGDVPVSPRPTGEIVSLERLAALPAEFLSELREAIVSLDPERISRAIEKVAAQDEALGSLLAGLAERFAYTPILTAIDATSRAV